eukprot:1119904-Ditylum_brightwellii.AAC.1
MEETVIEDTSASKEDEPMKEENTKPTESSPITKERPDSTTLNDKVSKPVEISSNNNGEPGSESFEGEEEEQPKKSSPISVATQSVSHNGDETLTRKSSKKIGGVVILMIGVGEIAAVLGEILFEKRRCHNEPQ